MTDVTTGQRTCNKKRLIHINGKNNFNIAHGTTKTELRYGKKDFLIIMGKCGGTQDKIYRHNADGPYRGFQNIFYLMNVYMAFSVRLENGNDDGFYQAGPENLT